jgi:hypothetical protein
VGGRRADGVGGLLSACIGRLAFFCFRHVFSCWVEAPISSPSSRSHSTPSTACLPSGENTCLILLC